MVLCYLLLESSFIKRASLLILGKSPSLGHFVQHCWNQL